MCGVIGIKLAADDEHVCGQLVDGLTVLQHRGQDAAGVITCHETVLHMRKANGLVSDVFKRAFTDLVGPMGLGHCRYPTAGSASSAEAQPFYTNSPFGICMAHNGNLTNYDDLRAFLASRRRHLNTNSDSEVLMNVFALALYRQLGDDDAQPTPDHLFEAVRDLMTKCRGGYVAVCMIVGVGMLCFRDPHGIRPGVYGTNEQGSVIFASESVAVDTLGYTTVGDIEPGQAVFVDMNNRVHKRVCHDAPSLAPCIFEFVYLARPDSVLDGVSVYQARLSMGAKLAAQIKASFPDHGIDVVVPVPDTSRPSAYKCAIALQVPYREALIKNRYIARTFIMPGQTTRNKGIKMKLNTIRTELEGKSVLLVDDSIVRGNTSKQIIALVRAAGAKRVFFASAAPEVSFPNVYGIDMPTFQELVAHKKSPAQIAEVIGADWVVFQKLGALEQCVRELNGSIPRFESSCFSGEYITGDVDKHYLSRLESNRNDSRFECKKHKAMSVVEMHNRVKHD